MRKLTIKKDFVIYSIILLILSVILGIVSLNKINDSVAEFQKGAMLLKTYFGLIIFIALLTGLILGFLICYRKTRLEKIFVVTSAGLGIIMGLLITPYAVPDEEMHFNTVYAISNSILELELPLNDIEVNERVDDATIPLTFEVSTQNYLTVAENIFHGADNTEYIKKPVSTLETDSFFFYIPAVIGNLTGRWLDMGTIQMMYLSRGLMLATYITLVYFAIRLVPVGKNTMFLLGIMPMALQQASSMSYDCVINGTAMLFTAIMVRFIYSDRMPLRWEVVVAVITGFLVVIAKSGAYVPLLLLAFAIPAKRFGGKKRKTIIACIAIGATAVILLYIYSGLFGGTGDTEGHIISWTGTEGYTLGHILTHPGNSLKMLFSTLLHHSHEYLLQMTGSYFGWFKIVINPIIVLMYIAIMIASAFEKNDDIYVTVKQKLLYIFAALMSCMIIFLSMWIFWTPLEYKFIAGIQGRYFIPLCFVVLLVFRNRKLGIKQYIQNKLILTAFLIEVAIMCQFVMETAIY